MKSLIKAVSVVVVFAVPALSFAQSSQPVTRAEVNAQIVQIEHVDHSHELFGDSNVSYPAVIQAADARVSAQNGTAAATFGGISDDSSGSGAPVRPVSASAWRSMYGHS